MARGSYDEPYFTNRMKPEIRDAYFRYKQAITEMCQPNALELICTQRYMKFSCQNKDFISLTGYKGMFISQVQFILNLRKNEYSDPYGITTDIEGKGRSGIQGDYRINNAEHKDFNQVMELIRQVYNKRVLGGVTE